MNWIYLRTISSSFYYSCMRECLLFRAGWSLALKRALMADWKQSEWYIKVEAVLFENLSGSLEVFLAGGLHVLEHLFVLVGIHLLFHRAGQCVTKRQYNRVRVLREDCFCYIYIRFGSQTIIIKNQPILNVHNSYV